MVRWALALGLAAGAVAVTLATSPTARVWLATDLGALAGWWAALSLLGLAVRPLTAPIAAHLPDRGAALNRGAGLVAASYLAWISGSAGLLPYDRTPALVWVGALALLGALVAWSSGWRPRGLTGAGRFAADELGFGAILLFFQLLYQHNPRAYLRSGDQVLDIGLANSVARASSFPPPDFWVAGHTLNYYYFGYVEQSLLAKMTGLPAGVAYNLGMASVMALATSLVLATGWAVSGRVGGGLLAALLFGLTHNLAPLGQAIAAGRLTGLDWARSEHLIRETLSSPPIVTMMTGELHSHFLSLPLVALICAVAFASASAPAPTRPRAARLAAAVTVGLILGAAGPTHFLHAPVAVGLWVGVQLAVALACRSRAGLPETAVSLGVAAVAYLPFYLSYHSSPGQAVVLNRVPTEPVAILTLFGAFAVPLCLWAVLSGPARAARRVRGLVRAFELVLAVALAAALLTGRLPQPGLLLYAGLTLICLDRLLGAAVRRADAGTVYAWVAASAAWGVLTAIEIVTVDAPTITATMRFNVAWKTYLAVWVPLSIAAAAAIVALWTTAGSGRPALPGRLAAGAGVGLVALGCLSALLFGLGRLEGLRNNFGGDGLRFMQLGGQTEREDGAIVEWLNQNAGSGDVLLEVAGGLQYPYGRFSGYTGLTAVLGWHHVANAYQGLPIPEVRQREHEVESIYRNADPARSAELLARYRVRFVVVSAFEEGTYGPLDREGLRRLGATVFTSGRSEIIEVAGARGG